MPVVLFVPHPRMNVSKNQISFFQIAKMIYLLALVGCSQRPQIQASVIQESDYTVQRYTLQLSDSLVQSSDTQTIQQFE